MTEVQEGQSVRVSENEPDESIRGKLATVLWNLPKRFGPDPYWHNGAIVTADDGLDYWVELDGLEPAEPPSTMIESVKPTGPDPIAGSGAPPAPQGRLI